MVAVGEKETIEAAISAATEFFALDAESRVGALADVGPGHEGLHVTATGPWRHRGPRTVAEWECVAILAKARLVLLKAAEQNFRKMVAPKLANELLADMDETSVLTIFRHKAGTPGYSEYVNNSLLTLTIVDTPGLEVLLDDENWFTHPGGLDCAVLCKGASLEAVTTNAIAATKLRIMHNINDDTTETQDRVFVSVNLNTNATITLANDTRFDLGAFRQHHRKPKDSVPISVSTPPKDSESSLNSNNGASGA